MNDLFSIIRKDKLFSLELKSLYKKYIETYDLDDNIKNLFIFLTFQTQKYDINFNVLIIGAARIGKSTLAYEIAKFQEGSRALIKYAGLDNYIITSDYLSNKVIYGNEKNNNFAKQKNSTLWLDEAYFIADRRESMQSKTIEYSHLINTLASNNNTILTLIQNMQDLDNRISNPADAIIYLLERGKAYLYTRPKTHSSISNVKWNILDLPQWVYSKDERSFRRYIRHNNQFRGVIKWDDNKYDIGYILYKKYKHLQQDKSF